MASTAKPQPQPSFSGEWSPKSKTYLDIFLHLLPVAWMKEVLLPTTSVAVEGDGLLPVSWGELLRFLGLWLLMSTVSGWQKADFWSTSPYDEQEHPCPYRFDTYMSRRRFMAIGHNLRFTNHIPPSYVDKFWQVRQMLTAFNEHTATIFLASWVIYLDESMSIWHNR